MATIIIPAPLRKFTGNSSKVKVEENNIRDVLATLTLRFPELKRHLFDTDEKVRPFINIFIGEKDIRSFNQQSIAIVEDTVISIVPAIAGGAL